jgi:hypothetical protein
MPPLARPWPWPWRRFGRRGCPPFAAVPLDPVAALEVASHLIETRPRALQTRDRHGRVPLHAWAAHWSSRVDVTPVLVEPRPESLLVADHEGRLPLHVLLERDDAPLDGARLLLEPVSVRIRDNLGHLQLRELMAMARLLMEADLGSLLAQDRQGRMPLLVAVTIPLDPSLDMVRLLVKASPRSPHLLDPQGLVPLQVAAAHDAPLDIVYYLARH